VPSFNLHPIGKVNDYFYRVEFQQRGSPHIHILIWVEDAPKYKENPNEDIVEYIDKHVSCNLSDEFKDLIALQVHKHSDTNFIWLSLQENFSTTKTTTDTLNVVFFSHM
jgi:hypothetical protein